jgi:hypothetical protein
MLRASGAKKRYKSPEVEDNGEMRLFVGNSIHNLTYCALEWAGLLVEHERSVVFPDLMGGRFDCIYYDHVADRLVLWDGKTVRGAKLREHRDELPSPKDVAQISSYAHARKGWDVCCLEYIDREGENSPEMCFFAPGPAEHTEAEIAALIAAYHALPDLPDPIKPEVYVTRKQPRRRKTETYEQWEARRAEERQMPSAVYLRRQWQCGWCDYRDASCQPLGPEEPVKLADFEGLKPVLTDDGRKRQSEVEEVLAA